MKSPRRAVPIFRRELVFPKQNRKIEAPIDCNAQSVHNSRVERGSLRTKFTRLPLFYAQIRYTKFLYSLRIIWYLSLILKGLSLPKKKIKKMLKDFAALWVYLMFGSNVNYFVMGGDVWKVCNGAQQVKITFLSISLFAFINQKLSANFLSVPLGMLFLQSMQHLK